MYVAYVVSLFVVIQPQTALFQWRSWLYNTHHSETTHSSTVNQVSVSICHLPNELLQLHVRCRSNTIHTYANTHMQLITDQSQLTHKQVLFILEIHQNNQLFWHCRHFCLWDENINNVIIIGCFDDFLIWKVHQPNEGAFNVQWLKHTYTQQKLCWRYWRVVCVF